MLIPSLATRQRTDELMDEPDVDPIEPALDTGATERQAVAPAVVIERLVVIGDVVRSIVLARPVVMRATLLVFLIGHHLWSGTGASIEVA